MNSINDNLSRININLENIKNLLNLLIDINTRNNRSPFSSRFSTRPTRENIEISLVEPRNLDFSNIFSSIFTDLNSNQQTNLTHSAIIENTVIDVASDENEICSICRETFTDNNIIRKINRCGHQFHCSCLDTWLNTNSTCPLCRVDIRGPQRESRE